MLLTLERTSRKQSLFYPAPGSLGLGAQRLWAAVCVGGGGAVSESSPSVCGCLVGAHECASRERVLTFHRAFTGSSRTKA